MGFGLIAVRAKDCCLRRYNAERHKISLSVPATPSQFVEWIGCLRPLHLPRAWQLYKASCVYMLYAEPWLLWTDQDRPTTRLVTTTIAFFRYVHKEFAVEPFHSAKEAWAVFVIKMQDVLRHACQTIWPERKHQLALYSTRHAAASFFKTYLQPCEVAALLGHAVDETAFRNYARAKNRSGNLSPKEVLNMPTANPIEVARVREELNFGKVV